MIYTGYYAKLKKYENAGLTPIAISGITPKFFEGLTYKEFAPRKEMFQRWKNGEIDNFQYTREYKAYLDTLDKEEIRFDFKEYNTVEHDCILLCYEKSGDFCHRHILADWLEENFGYRVEEYVC